MQTGWSPGLGGPEHESRVRGLPPESLGRASQPRASPEGQMSWCRESPGLCAWAAAYTPQILTHLLPHRDTRGPGRPTRSCVSAPSLQRGAGRRLHDTSESQPKVARSWHLGPSGSPSRCPPAGTVPTGLPDVRLPFSRPTDHGHRSARHKSDAAPPDSLRHSPAVRGPPAVKGPKPRGPYCPHGLPVRKEAGRVTDDRREVGAAAAS